jgi:hypothetical protein
MIEDDLPGFLTDDSDVAALVITGSLSRIFPLVIPQHLWGEVTKLPCLVYQRDGSGRGSTYCSQDTLIWATFQFDCYARTEAQMRQLARAIRLRLQNFRGMMGDTEVRIALLENDFDGLDPDPGLYRRTQRWVIWHIET